jgi:hypothetical protein
MGKQIAASPSSVTRRDILFFPLYDVAVNYLQALGKE